MFQWVVEDLPADRVSKYECARVAAPIAWSPRMRRLYVAVAKRELAQ